MDCLILDQMYISYNPWLRVQNPVPSAFCLCGLHIYTYNQLKIKDIWKTFQKVPKCKTQICHSVQFSRSVVSDSLWTHEWQHARPPCPSPTPGVHPDSRPSSQWCHPAISSSVVPFFPLSSPSPLAPNPSQHQSLFQWINSSHEVAKVLEFQL